MMIMGGIAVYQLPKISGMLVEIIDVYDEMDAHAALTVINTCRTFAIIDQRIKCNTRICKCDADFLVSVV